MRADKAAIFLLALGALLVARAGVEMLAIWRLTGSAWCGDAPAPLMALSLAGHCAWCWAALAAFGLASLRLIWINTESRARGAA